MADIIQLKRASYKGVDFLFTEATTEGGNRLLKFRYPGSDKQSLERQGKETPSYPMTIWIPHDNYYEQKAALVRVLTDGRKGVLTHPTDGAVPNVLNGRYVLSEKITELGRASITVTFDIDNAPGVPQESGALAAQVQTAADAFNAQLSADLADGYEVDTGLTGNFSDALDNVSGAVEAISSATQVVTPITDSLNQFRATVQNVSSSVGDLVQAPSELASSIDGLFADMDNLYATPADTLAAFRALFDYGADDPVVPQDTVARIQRSQNRDLVRANLRSKALSYAYVSASQGDYTTTDDLDDVQDLLEAQYVDLRTNQRLSDASLELLDRLRVRAQDTLNLARVSTREIVEIETRRMPLSVLVYSYYGSTELVDTIADLNNIKQNAFVEGTLRILTI